MQSYTDRTPSGHQRSRNRALIAADVSHGNIGFRTRRRRRKQSARPVRTGNSMPDGQCRDPRPNLAIRGRKSA
jgi:hypothetical protein